MIHFIFSFLCTGGLNDTPGLYGTIYLHKVVWPRVWNIFLALSLHVTGSERVRYILSLVFFVLADLTTRQDFMKQRKSRRPLSPNKESYTVTLFITSLPPFASNPPCHERVRTRSLHFHKGESERKLYRIHVRYWKIQRKQEINVSNPCSLP